MAATVYTQTYIDHSRETSSSKIYVEDLATAANLAAVNAAVANIKTGLAAVTLCNFINATISSLVDPDTPTTPPDQEAQREIALWVQYVDDVTGDYGTFQVPGPDLGLLAQVGTDEVDVAANATAIAFRLVIEANAKSRDNNDVTVTRMRIIGRRS